MVVTGSTENLAHFDVACVLRKPVDPDDLLRVVRRCLMKDAGAAGV